MRVGSAQPLKKVELAFWWMGRVLEFGMGPFKSTLKRVEAREPRGPCQQLRQVVKL